jgi:hypothetical protein
MLYRGERIGQLAFALWPIFLWQDTPLRGNLSENQRAIFDPIGQKFSI